MACMLSSRSTSSFIRSACGGERFDVRHRLLRDRWWEGWLQKDWTNSQKRPVANRDLWEPLIAIVRQRGITFRWVKAHSGDPMNELVDRLAVEALRTQQGRQGVVPELVAEDWS